MVPAIFMVDLMLIIMAKDGDTLLVHPTCVAAHRRAGWVDTGLTEGSDAVAIAAPEPPQLIIAKGPRGLWYVMKDGARASPGFASEADAMASIGE